MTHVHSFPALSAPHATLLILGSMPGRMSLELNQYYAHPRNAFWRILEDVLELPTNLDYAARCTAIIAQGIAVWDVLKTCTRSGSLDSAIVAATIVPNDFATFLREHAAITTICFNGAAAQQIWMRHIAPHLPADVQPRALVRLPSTSPAHAGMDFATKAQRWREVLETRGASKTAAPRQFRK